MIADSHGVRIAYEEHRRRASRSCSSRGSATTAGGGSRSCRCSRSAFRVLVFDNRGVGDSDGPPGPYTAAEMAGDALAVLDAAGVERAHVLGVSLGGAVAQELALRHPERVGEARPRRDDVGHDEHAPDAGADAAADGGGGDARAGGRAAPVRRERARAGVRERPSSSSEIVELRTANAPDPAGWAAQAGIWATFDVWTSCRRSTCRRSSCRARETSSSIRATHRCSRSGSRARSCEVVAGAAPVLLERPGEFAELVMEFLR